MLLINNYNYCHHNIYDDDVCSICSDYTYGISTTSTDLDSEYNSDDTCHSNCVSYTSHVSYTNHIDYKCNSDASTCSHDCICETSSDNLSDSINYYSDNYPEDELDNNCDIEKNTLNKKIFNNQINDQQSIDNKNIKKNKYVKLYLDKKDNLYVKIYCAKTKKNIKYFLTTNEPKFTSKSIFKKINN